jgi:hypothetical protein
MEITVKNAMKFGVSTTDGRLLSNYDKSYDHTKAKAGDILDVDIKVSKAGKEYINKVKERKHLVQTATVVKGRDFDAEARGKTRCAAFGDALSSPSLANFSVGMSEEEFLQLVERVAERQVKYTFGDK